MTEQEHRGNQASCYCGVLKESDGLDCSLCHRLIHPGCLVSGRPSPLAGDIYFNLTCKECAKDGQEICKRIHLSWIQTVYLALYNLSLTSSGRKGFYRWKEDICQFIERNWSLLFPKRKRTISWCSTVAGTLSVGCPHYFKSGQKEFKETGWWALQDKVAPIEKLGSPGSETKRKKNSSKVTSKRKAASVDTERQENEETKKPKEENDSLSLTGDPEELDSLFSGVAMGTDSDEIIARLLRGDEGTSLTDMPFPFMELDEPFTFLTEHNENVDNKNSLQDEQYQREPTTTTEEEQIQQNESMKEQEKDDEQENSGDDESVASTVRSEVKRTTKARNTLDQDTSSIVKEKNLSMVSEADEHEMLCRLNACTQAIQDDCVARRLRRKLILRKHKRENGLPIFDLDKIITSSLTSTKAYVFKNDDFVPMKYDDYMEGSLMTENKSTATQQKKQSVLTRYSRVLDRFLAAPQMLRRKDQNSSTFLSRLVGADRQTLVRPITSPYTARVLKPFIRRDFESRPLKLRLMNEILAYHRRKDPTVVPPKPHPIDYCYVQPHHIPAVNAMCREFFWPGIDLSECLHYPDFSCVVLYRSFVIAFAFMVPDVKYNEAYISFILVHPEWRRAGIGTYMLYHLIQTCMGKDVTLHVSANNQAMLMYQKFGFKPEEFILDFYEKYLPETSRECRHAFFLRLRR